ncbi:MAG: ATP-binding cassette domain-containing protein [Eubacteriales bacterium]|nr:ATP-binding cassette domain-containing protein [Eubacteriales bacterium]
MEIYKIENLTFTYPNSEKPSLRDINITIEQGEFVVICGKSGCGKSTLLRHLKSSLSPSGNKSGVVLFEGKLLEEVPSCEQSRKIGFVLQNPDNQIVTDKVWHELAFGLESLGYETGEIRARVAEMASFFGIQDWFHKSVSKLSGGQKQILSLASVMAMQPDVLILDEPTSQLDPIAALEFLQTIARINRELGTTVILAEHRLEDAFPMSNRVVVMDGGKIIAHGTPKYAGEILKKIEHDMLLSLPTPMRIHLSVESPLECPVTVREGRRWLEDLSKIKNIDHTLIPKEKSLQDTSAIIQIREAWFRYDRNLPDVIKGLSAEIYENELYAIVGGNGTGKTTALSIIGGLLAPYRGQVLVKGEKISNIRDKYNGLIGVLPQNPQALFVKNSVLLDLYEIFRESKVEEDEQKRLINEVVKMCALGDLLGRHPYDLSVGEQQRAALAKVLLLKPQILLLDEPTKGLDAHFKQNLAEILGSLKNSGVTIVMVSHDIEFCAKFADRCAMFFDGKIISCDMPRRFFANKSFYTTAASRMAREKLPGAVLAEDVMLACGAKVAQKSNTNHEKQDIAALPKKYDIKTKPARPAAKGAAFGSVFLVLFILTAVFYLGKWSDKEPTWQSFAVQISMLFELGLSLFYLIPRNKEGANALLKQSPKTKKGFAKSAAAAWAAVVLAVPLTIYIGLFYLGDRKYYFTSLMIILESMLPFLFLFEKRRPKARELVVVGVLCAMAVAGRSAFFMLPQFKPVLAIVIVSGVCFGAETGFLVGAVAAFVSNMFFGQGPWTPWQMFAFGMIGFLAGMLFGRGLIKKTKTALCVFGGFSAFFIYGGIMNPASVLMWQAKPNMEMIISAYLMGIPFDLIHTGATVVFLYFISSPLMEKLERIKVKYGLMELG